jgi:hypothetical protein
MLNIHITATTETLILLYAEDNCLHVCDGTQSGYQCFLGLYCLTSELGGGLESQRHENIVQESPRRAQSMQCMQI